MPAKLVKTAQTNPRLLSIDDDYDDYLWNLQEDEEGDFSHWGSGKHALDLDKAFNDFQSQWHGEAPRQRPALELVRGWVTHTPRGHRSHYGVIEPGRVTAIRDDARATRDGDLADFIESGGGRYADEPQSDVRSLLSYRDQILVFLDVRIDRGEGVLYTIG